MQDLKPLKLAALAATPGPWEVDSVRSDGEYGSDDDGGYGFDSYQVTTDTGACVVDCLNNDVGAVHVENDGRAWDKVAKQDAQYIAAASPDVVLALVAEVEQLRRDKMELQRRYSEQKLQEARLDDEVLRLHRQLAGETLRANQGWARYEQANKARMGMEFEKDVAAWVKRKA